MSDKLNVITGASGQLGSHIAEQLRSTSISLVPHKRDACATEDMRDACAAEERGEQVRALVRAASDTSFLKQLGVELQPCDYHDPVSVRRAVAGADIVYHCAARVSDWGPWPAFQREIVDVARNVLEACQAENVGRVLFVSSISVYGHPRIKPGEVITEDAPLGQNMWLWDYYAKAKVEAEKLAWQYPGGITVVRPSWIYGPRDRVTIPRVVPALQSQRVPIIGKGDNLLNLIYAGDVARGCILAANHPEAAGQAYNLSSRGELTQKQMIDTLTDALELPRVQKHVPFPLVKFAAFMQEFFARMLRKEKPPRITRRAVYLIGRPAQFSIEKAQRELGWEPQVDIQEGIKQALDWYQSHREPSP